MAFYPPPSPPGPFAGGDGPHDAGAPGPSAAVAFPVRARLASPWKENCIKDYYGVRVALNTPELYGRPKEQKTSIDFESLRVLVPYGRSIKPMEY